MEWETIVSNFLESHTTTPTSPPTILEPASEQAQNTTTQDTHNVNNIHENSPLPPPEDDASAQPHHKPTPHSPYSGDKPEPPTPDHIPPQTPPSSRTTDKGEDHHRSALTPASSSSRTPVRKTATPRPRSPSPTPEDWEDFYERFLGPHPPPSSPPTHASTNTEINLCTVN